MIKLKTNKIFIKYQKKLEIKTIRIISIILEYIYIYIYIYNKFELNNKINN
jgi:hypothetical protein